MATADPAIRARRHPASLEPTLQRAIGFFVLRGPSGLGGSTPGSTRVCRWHGTRFDQPVTLIRVPPRSTVEANEAVDSDRCTFDRVILHGVINASPDSLAEFSIATTPETALERAQRLLADGADGIDIGGQGSTDVAEVVDWATEWARLEPLIPELARLGVDISIDSWRPEVVRCALQAGATIINAADGMQHDEMWKVATDFDVPIVVPFLSGPDPRRMSRVESDPLRAMTDFFDARLADADRFGLRARCIIDPGTGFAPPHWPWEERFVYQKHVYSNLGVLHRYGLPIYIALPWKETAQHDELLEIVVRQRPDYGRCHHPAKVRAFERRLAADR